MRQVYICIDLKSFYASVECVERGLDPMTAKLVVADAARTDKTICLAVSPALKALGVKNRCRVFEIPKGLEYIMATPRMALYIKYSAKIYSVYLRHFSPEDIHVYSIDEVFIDISRYPALRSMSPREFVLMLLREIRETTGLVATCGIGSNLYLAKIALDIISKHAPDFIGELNEKSYKELAPLVDKLRVQNIRVAHQLEQLNSSREQLSLITENMSEGLMIIGCKSTVLSCNSAAIRLLGNPNFKEGQSVYALNNSETFRRCIMNALGGVRSECILKADGGEREVIASPASGTGALCGIVVFVMDVTERQQLETMRREFTSNVSHELKTPLTTIYGISDMLAGGMVDPADVPRFGADIKTEADRMITLISDIISLSKLDESDSSPHEEEDIDIYELAQETLDRLKVGAAQKNVTCTLTGEHVHINGSRTVLGEVIYNLCDNAVKYNKEGGSVTVKVSHIPKIAMITVSDTGIGIPPEHLGRIFERFYRVDKSRSRRIKGTGLGLSIVKHGVLYHGGTVRADSTQGEGTTFTVELPITPQNVNA